MYFLWRIITISYKIKAPYLSSNYKILKYKKLVTYYYKKTIPKFIKTGSVGIC